MVTTVKEAKTTSAEGRRLGLPASGEPAHYVGPCVGLFASGGLEDAQRLAEATAVQYPSLRSKRVRPSAAQEYVHRAAQAQGQRSTFEGTYPRLEPRALAARILRLALRQAAVRAVVVHQDVAAKGHRVESYLPRLGESVPFLLNAWALAGAALLPEDATYTQRRKAYQRVWDGNFGYIGNPLDFLDQVPYLLVNHIDPA